MIKYNEQVSYEIELIINENLYKKKIITEDVYRKVNERLIKYIELCKAKNKSINDSS